MPRRVRGKKDYRIAAVRTMNSARRPDRLLVYLIDTAFGGLGRLSLVEA